MNEKVMKDYAGMTELAEMYKEDAVFYSDISGNLGAASREMSEGMEGINVSIGSIAALMGEIARSMCGMEQFAESSDQSSRSVLARTKELFRLSELLNQTVTSFKV